MTSAYTPLIVILLTVLFSALALSSSMHFMQAFMGLTLVIFAMFKFFDLKGFAKGFRMYDLLAKRSRAYAFTYPFIELLLGLGYLSGCAPLYVNITTLIVMGFGAIGVIYAIAHKMNVNCACLGTMLKVPLSTVSIVENVGMAAMAGYMLAVL